MKILRLWNVLLSLFQSKFTRNKHFSEEHIFMALCSCSLWNVLFFCTKKHISTTDWLTDLTLCRLSCCVCIKLFCLFLFSRKYLRFVFPLFSAFFSWGFFLEISWITAQSALSEMWTNNKIASQQMGINIAKIVFFAILIWALFYTIDTSKLAT